MRDLLRHLVTHPKDVVLVAGAAWRLRARGWWRRAPFLPLPGEAYWNFRRVTASGSARGMASGREVVDVARWSRRQRSRS